MCKNSAGGQKRIQHQNIDWLSKFFHCANCAVSFNKVVTHAVTSWNISIQNRSCSVSDVVNRLVDQIIGEGTFPGSNAPNDHTAEPRRLREPFFFWSHDITPLLRLGGVGRWTCEFDCRPPCFRVQPWRSCSHALCLCHQSVLIWYHCKLGR